MFNGGQKNTDSSKTKRNDIPQKKQENKPVKNSKLNSLKNNDAINEKKPTQSQSINVLASNNTNPLPKRKQLKEASNEYFLKRLEELEEEMKELQNETFDTREKKKGLFVVNVLDHLLYQIYVRSLVGNGKEKENKKLSFDEWKVVLRLVKEKIDKLHEKAKQDQGTSKVGNNAVEWINKNSFRTFFGGHGTFQLNGFFQLLFGKNFTICKEPPYDKIRI